MEIRTERLTLVPSGIRFLDSAFEYTSDIENTRLMSNLPNETVGECAEYLLKADAEWARPAPDYYEFAVLLNGAHIGGVSLFPDENDRTRAELGWILHKNHWGNGYAAEAARALIDFAVRDLGITRFTAHCDSENTGSYRVMEKLGMTRTGYWRGRKNRASDEDRGEFQYDMEVETMKTYKIAVIAGDGIGPEVIAEGVKVLQKVAETDGSFRFEFTHFPWGCNYYKQTGRMMPEDGIDTLRAFDAILLGAVGDPAVPDHISLWDLLLAIRKNFDQYVNLRPVKLLRGAPCPLSDVAREDIDMLFVRENSEGEYAGSGSRLYRNTPREVVIQDGVFSRHGCERVIRYAFETARAQKRSLTSISKGNALNYSMVFWDQIFNEIAAEYPDVETRRLLVDAAAMFMVKDPKRFEVVVTSNLFGDILTDLGAAISGGMGLAAGANLNPERKFPSMFEPIHGSAPDIAGRGKANPLATVWSAAQLLEFFGHKAWSDRLIEIIEELLTEKTCLTPDLDGSATTSQVGDAVCAKICN